MIVVEKMIVVLSVMLLLMGLVTSEGLADTSASCTITIRVEAIDVIGVDPIDPINPGETGETDLKWTTNGDDRKVFVRVDPVPESLKTLKVEALTEGYWGEHRQPSVGAGEVILDSTDQYELISAVGGAAGGCKIKYTAEVDPEATLESEVVEVSYIFTTSDGSPLDVSSHQLTIDQELLLGEGFDQGEVTYITITDHE